MEIKDGHIIFLDTNVFISENFLRGYNLKSIASHSKEGDIEVKITEINYREVISNIEKSLTTAKTALKNIKELAKSKEGRILQLVDFYGFLYPIKKLDIATEKSILKTKFDAFLEENLIEVIPSIHSDDKEVFDWYFNKDMPFGLGKKKDEFPDAFMLSIIKNWSIQKGEPPIIIVSDDGGVKEWKPPSDNIKIAGSLKFLLNLISEKLSGGKLFDKLKESVQTHYHLTYNYSFERENMERLNIAIEQHLQYRELRDYIEIIDSKIKDYEIFDIKLTTITSSNLVASFDVSLFIDAEYTYDDFSRAVYDKEDGTHHNVITITAKDKFLINISLAVFYEYFESDLKVEGEDIVEFIRHKELDFNVFHIEKIEDEL